MEEGVAGEGSDMSAPWMAVVRGRRRGTMDFMIGVVDEADCCLMLLLY